MAKKKKMKLPSFIEIYMSERKPQIEQKGGFWKDKSKYDRNKAKEDFRKESF